VDSFTNEPFKGNPAGVCILENDLGTTQMHTIAKELGLSETAFIKKDASSNKYTIRFFSPKMEIPLCGHATLAASQVLFERNAEMQQIHFVNIEHIDLLIEKIGDKIQMEFPIYETTPAEVPKALLAALGVNNVINSQYNVETEILLLEIEDSIVLQGLKPNFEALYKSHDTINGVLVTATSKKTDFDFESRYFWPWSGTNEDPATGGTHTFLAKYWSKRLHKTKMKSFQCSERTGFMEVELISDTTFTITSMAKIVLEGSLKI